MSILSDIKDTFFRKKLRYQEGNNKAAIPADKKGFQNGYRNYRLGTIHEAARDMGCSNGIPFIDRAFRVFKTSVPSEWVAEVDREF